MAEKKTPDGFSNGEEELVLSISKVVNEHKSQSNGFEESSSKTDDVYPVVKSLCEDLIRRRVQRELAHENILKKNEISRAMACVEAAEIQNMKKQLAHMSQKQEEVRKRWAHLDRRLVHVENIKNDAEKKVMSEKSRCDSCDKEVKQLSFWFQERQSNIEKLHRKKEEFAGHLEIQREANFKAVDFERQKRKEISEERDRIKTQQRKNMQESLEHNKKRRDDLRQKIDQVVSSNERGQELNNLQEKLKEVQHQIAQYSAEIEAATLKDEEDLLSFNTSMQTVKKAILQAVKEEIARGKETQKIKEACDKIIEENKMLVKDIREDAKDKGMMFQTFVEVKDLLLKKSLTGTNEKNVVQRYVISLENRLSQLKLEHVHLMSTKNEMEKRRGESTVELAKFKENNESISEEVDIAESLLQYAVEKTNENAVALTEKEPELEEISCGHTSQKMELKKTWKLIEEQNALLFVKKHRLLQIETSLANLRDSTKSMRDIHVRLLSTYFEDEGKTQVDIVEIEKPESQLRDAIKGLENEQQQLHVELTDLCTETADCQEELKKLKTAKMDFQQMSLSHAEQMRIKQVEVEDLRSSVAAAEQNCKNVLENCEECERICEVLRNKVFKVITPQRDALLKDVGGAVASEIPPIDKRMKSPQVARREQKEKLRLEENKAKVGEMTARFKQQLNILDEEKREVVESIEVANLERETLRQSESAKQMNHEQVLHAYDSANHTLSQVKGKYALAKQQKIKLLNTIAMNEKVSAGTEARENEAIESKRAELETLKYKYRAMVQRHDKHLDELKRRFAAFQGRIADIKEKRKIDEENIAAGLPFRPKPIIKSPSFNGDGEDATLKKSVSFAQSPDNLQILPSDSSIETVDGSKGKKRKLFSAPQQNVKSCKNSSDRTISQ